MAQYLLSATVSPPQAGTVSGTGWHGEGSPFSVQATATMEGYQFWYWEAVTFGAFIEENPWDGVMPPMDVELIAIFGEGPPQPPKRPVTLHVSPANAGSVSGAGDYAQGQTVHISATAFEGYLFSHWEESGIAQNYPNPYAFTMPNYGRTLTAVFSEVRYIDTAEDLDNVRYHLNAHCIQREHITLPIGWTPIGHQGGSSYSTFNGTYDGNGKRIRGLSARDSSASHMGLFARLGAGAEVKNLIMEYPAVLARNNAGAIAGGMNGNARIENCHVIAGSISVAYVDSYTAGQYAGGIVGIVAATAGRVERCSFIGNVRAGRYAGGVVGLLSGQMTNCFSRGTVSGRSYIGGLTGQGSNFSFCYTSTALTGQGHNVYAVWVRIGRMNTATAFPTGERPASARCYYNAEEEVYGRRAYWPFHGFIDLVKHCANSGYERYLGDTIYTNNVHETHSGKRWFRSPEDFAEYNPIGSMISKTLEETDFFNWFLWEGEHSRTREEMTYPHAANTYKDWDFETIWAIDENINEGFPYLITHEYFFGFLHGTIDASTYLQLVSIEEHLALAGHIHAQTHLVVRLAKLGVFVKMDGQWKIADAHAHHGGQWNRTQVSGRMVEWKDISEEGGG